MMTENGKYVGRRLCDERHGNIEKSIDDLHKKVDRIMINDLPHLRADMAKIAGAVAVIVAIFVSVINYVIR
jgi:hypothetical protein